MTRLTKNNYEDDLFELQATKKIKVQAQYNDYLWKAVKEKEDLEEELGIDLITKDKIEQSNVCYWKNKSKKIHKLFINATERIGVDVENIDGQKWFLYYRNYGKTWALTREELENDK